MLSERASWHAARRKREKSVPPESQAKVVWSDSSKRRISEEQRQIAPGAGAVSFEMKDVAGAAVADYQVDFFHGDPEGEPGK